MNELQIPAVQNGCHILKGPQEVTAPATESPPTAKTPIPTQANLSQPSELSASKPVSDLKGIAQLATTTSTVGDKNGTSISGPIVVCQTDSAVGNPSDNSSTNGTAPSKTPPAASAELSKQELISKSVKEAENVKESLDNAAISDDGNVGKEKKGKAKREAKSSKRKDAETKKSKSKKSRENSANDEAVTIDGVASGKVNKTSETRKKKERKRKQSESSDGEPRTGKRVRLPHMPFQHPAAQQIPQFYKNSFSNHRQSSRDSADDKIVVFSRGEFLAVRNDSDSFYICRTTQNVYKTSRKFKIQWLQNEKNKDIYQLDFLDQTDFECVLTNLRLNRRSKGEYELPADEKQRVLNILQRAINVERGVTDVPDLKQVAADGIDVSVVGKKEEKELLELEANSKKETLPAESTSKSKALSAEPVAAKSTRHRKVSTESSRSSRKSEASQKENSKKRDKSPVAPIKKAKAEKVKKKNKLEKSAEVANKKLRDKKAPASASNVQTSSKSKDQVLVEKIVDEIVKKHKIQQQGEKEKKKKRPTDEKEVKKAAKEEMHRSSRLTRNMTVPPAPSSLTKPPQHHETIRGLVNLLNSYSSSSLRTSTLQLLERLAAEYPKDCLPFLVETLLTCHCTFLENDDNCKYLLVVIATVIAGLSNISLLL